MYKKIVQETVSGICLGVCTGCGVQQKERPALLEGSGMAARRKRRCEGSEWGWMCGRGRDVSADTSCRQLDTCRERRGLCGWSMECEIEVQITLKEAKEIGRSQSI